jgi:protein-tyrosine-phosphatase
MPSILIVCTANQCRSPMAMMLLRQLLLELNTGEEWVVDSAGTWGPDGIPATENAIQAMRLRGLDLGNHRSRKINAGLLSSYDLILTMEGSHQEAIQVEFPDQAEKVYRLSEMVGEKWDVKDPVGKPLEDYRTTADLLDGTLHTGLKRILESARSGARGCKAE